MRLALDNLEQALADYTRAIEIAPANATYFYDRGIARAREGDLEEAITDFAQALQLNPGLLEAAYQRGLAYQRTATLDLARADFERVVQMDEEHAEALYHLGRLQALEGDLDSAIGSFTSAIDSDPEFDLPYLERSRLFHERSLNTEAIADLEAVLEISDNAETLALAQERLEELRQE